MNSGRGVREQQRGDRFPNVRLERVLAGLRESPKRIEPLWFYDARGSALFERICTTPEYYLTRTELGIMRADAPEMALALGPHVVLIEPGSGASLKTRLLLEALPAPRAYVPVDISREQLMVTARRLREDFPWLPIHPVCADFTEPFELPATACHREARRVVYFPGSTLGNFERSAAIDLLRRMGAIAGTGGAVLIGIDRVKPAPIMERAYNDEAGLTAAFNLNALHHLNRELGAGLDPQAFVHNAPWVPDQSRIEMRLVASRELAFEVGGERFEMARGEYLLTEYSHKYTLQDVAALAYGAGLHVRRTWSDGLDWFSVLLLEAGRRG
jgi:L-histidine Nalpha-methyltransferase